MSMYVDLNTLTVKKGYSKELIDINFDDVTN